MLLLTFPKVSIYLMKTFYSFIKTYVRLFLSTFCLYIILGGLIIRHKGLFFQAFFATNEIFKILVT